MQINFVNQTSDNKLPAQNDVQPGERAAAEDQAKISFEKTQDKVEIKEAPAPEVTLDDHPTSLKFSRDTQTNELIVELVNDQTGESIRQTPSPVSLKLSAIYEGLLQGKIVNKKY